MDVIINDKMYDYWHEELEFSLRTWTQFWHVTYEEYPDKKIRM